METQSDLAQAERRCCPAALVRVIFCSLARTKHVHHTRPITHYKSSPSGIEEAPPSTDNHRCCEKLLCAFSCGAMATIRQASWNPLGASRGLGPRDPE